MNKSKSKLIIPLLMICVATLLIGCVNNDSYIKVVKPTEREEAFLDIVKSEETDVFAAYEFKLDKSYKKLKIVSDVYHKGKIMKDTGTSFESQLNQNDSNKALIGMAMVNWRMKLTYSKGGSTSKKISLPKEFLKEYNNGGVQSWSYELSTQQIKENKPEYLSVIYLNKDSERPLSVIEPNSLMRDNIKELKKCEYCIVTYAIFTK